MMSFQTRVGGDDLANSAGVRQHRLEADIDDALS